MPDDRLVRFSVGERVRHWLVALTFVYCAATGLALWSPHLFWLAPVLGGGDTIRWGHPWGGVALCVALAAMSRRWASEMRLDAADRIWLRQLHRYAAHDESGLPESGRFNGGQKALFWVQAVAALLLLASGVVLWLPEAMPQGLRLAAVLIHPTAAVAAIAGLIVHVYMGTAAVPGAMRGMTQGWVTSAWAAAHHPKWFRQSSKS